jgi:hypothetical protein
MKALLFTLLLLFIVISPSVTAPPSQGIVHRNKQKIFYTFFTRSGVFNIELLYEPHIRSLVAGGYRNIDFTPRPGFTQVVIRRRRIDRWDLNVDPPRPTLVWITATINFTPPNHGGVELGQNLLAPGVYIPARNTVSLSQTTQLYIPGEDRGQRTTTTNTYPQTIYLVLMTVLPFGDVSLDLEAQRIIQTGILRASIQQVLQPFLTSPFQYYRLPLRLSPEIWFYLLTNRISEYHPGAIAGVPPPSPRSRPHPEEGCSGTRSRQRDKDDQDDPEAEREGKRTCPAIDLNEIPVDKGKGKAVDQGDQQAPVRTARIGRFSVFLNGLRTIGRYAKQAIQLLGRERYINPPRLTSAQEKNKEVIDVLKMARFSYGGQYGWPSFH